MARPVSLPPFLRSASRDPDSVSECYSGVFTHKICRANVDAHIRWWPCSSPDVRTIVLFIPGNPGLIDFYNEFLSTLHDTLREDGLAILAHAHLGHTPHLNASKTFGLLHQVEAALETFDAITACWPGIQVVIIGHSVGSWIATQILKARANGVDALFMLFPTISNIVQTPNGRRLSWLFNGHIAWAASHLSVLIRPITTPVLSLLFPSWPADNKNVLRSLLSSPQAIFACLTMARDEMRIISALDTSFLKEFSSKLWLYYAETDDWVGMEREMVIEFLEEPAVDRTVHDKHGAPHAFCILHSELLAAQCTSWLRHGGFVAEQVVIDI